MYKLIHESAENPASAYYCETLEEALSLFSQIQAIIDANRFSAKGSAILIDLETGEVYISYKRLFSPIFGTQLHSYLSLELTQL